MSSIIDANKYNSLVKLSNTTKLFLKTVKIFESKVSIKSRTNEAELNKQKLEQESVTEDLDVSLGTCKKIWIQDMQSTTVGERRYQNLNLFRDADGLLRCRGRLENADVMGNVKYPYLLLKNIDLLN